MNFQANQWVVSVDVDQNLLVPPAIVTSRQVSTDNDDSPFLEPADAARYLKLNVNTLRNKRCAGDGPPFRKHGRKVMYHIEDLNRWSEKTKRTVA